MIGRIRGILKVNQIYTCESCKTQENGSERYIHINEASGDAFSALIYILGTLDQKSLYMPTGWSFNGHFKCKNCKS